MPTTLQTLLIQLGTISQETCKQQSLTCKSPCLSSHAPFFSMRTFLPFAIFVAFAALVVAARHQVDPETLMNSQNSLVDPCHNGGYEKREVGNKATQQCDKILDQIGDICKKYFSDDGGEDDDKDDGTGWVFKYL